MGGLSSKVNTVVGLVFMVIGGALPPAPRDPKSTCRPLKTPLLNHLSTPPLFLKREVAHAGRVSLKFGFMTSAIFNLIGFAS